jgi:DNA-binding NarL/FixJ family response regulator
LIVSRQSEIRQLEDLLVAVRGGRSRSLVAVGPAGIGKSRLCRRAAELAEGFTVVRTRGIESEAQLGYGGLFDVLSPLLDGRLDRLLATRGNALRGALRIAETQGSDPFAVAVATLDLLAMAAEDAPVLVVVDDAPWVDAASLEALRFAARRLDADRVAFLFVARSELAAPLLDAGFESLTVEGLDTAEALGLVDEFAGAAVEESVARELRSSGGRAMRGPRARSDELTSQQLQIATMVAEGATNESVANSLFLSPKTIEFHLGHVYRKLDISNRTQLARSLPISPAVSSTH